MFRSDKQRRAMFANMFSTRNGFSLYISDDGFLRSTVYPDVNVELKSKETPPYLDAKDRISKKTREIVDVMDSYDEKKLAGLDYIDFTNFGKYHGASYVRRRANDTIGLPVEINELYMTRNPDYDGPYKDDRHELLKHELRHHIDDELESGGMIFDGMAFVGTKHIEDFANKKGQNFKERLTFAEKLKEKSTPTFEELEEYAK